MPSDIVDFAPAAGGRGRTAPSLSLPLAVVGAALGVASFLGEWQTVRIPAEIVSSQEQMFTASLTAAGALTAPYVITLFLLVTAVTIALFGEEQTRSVARLAGIALASCGLVLLGVISQQLVDGVPSVEGFYFSGLAGRMEAGLQWGFYAAAGAMLALGAAALLNRASLKPLRQEPTPDDDEAGHEADDAMQLSVIVEPVSRRAR